MEDHVVCLGLLQGGGHLCFERLSIRGVDQYPERRAVLNAVAVLDEPIYRVLLRAGGHVGVDVVIGPAPGAPAPAPEK